MKKALKITGIILLVLLAIGIYKSKTINAYINTYQHIKYNAEVVCRQRMLELDHHGEAAIKICEQFAKCSARKTLPYVEVDNRYWHSYNYRYITDEQEVVNKIVYECMKG